MEKDGWRVMAITFLILFLITCSFILYMFKTAEAEFEKEKTCANNVCAGLYSYYYDYELEKCYCIDDYGVVIIEKYLKEG